ncbi:AlbA family DNA-binding domain-containing protein [Nocardia tengchongensis]|uniref:AlbA family DNA-binding domain-containing protein n=1 Tax=Nocardia tengchongensis TaxID=2055889 RepID=UPI0036AA447A
MHSFPRLTALFGAPVDALTKEHLVAAVARKIPEAEDLDFKQALYENTTVAKQELAKDVSALANAGGGILILGVTDQNSAADSLTPLPLSAGEAERMQKICHYQIRPFLPGVHVKLVPEPADPDVGYYVISVPRSADAPHAVIRGGNDNGDGTLLSYALRDGQTTRYLAEAEIARRYRDRFVSRAELTAALDRVHDDGLARINSATAQAWLTLAAYPSAQGTQRVGGSHTVRQITEEVETWAIAAPSLPGQMFSKGLEGFPGVRRALVTRSPSYGGELNEAFAELHFSGAGFVTCLVMSVAGKTDGWQEPIALDVLELNLHAMVSLLSNHAASSGAGGECEFRAQLRLPPHVAGSGTGSVLTFRPAVLYAPAQRTTGGPTDDYDQVPRSIFVSTEFIDARTTSGLEELAESWQAQVRTAHTLAVDILGRFAVADTVVLRADGTFNVAAVDIKRANAISEWAHAAKP